MTNVVLRCIKSLVGTEPYPSYEQVREDIRAKLQEKLRGPGEIEKSFIPQKASHHILDEDHLEVIFKSLLPLKEFSNLNITKEHFCQSIKDDKLYVILATIIFARCDVKALYTFTSKFIVKKELALRRLDRHQELEPLSRDQCMTLLDNDESEVEKFEHFQPIFYPIKVRERVQLEALSTRRFPYLEEEEIGKGTFGHVFRVKVEKRHLILSHDDLTNSKPKPMARKDYIVKRTERGSLELEILNAILENREHSDNIVKSFGTVEIPLPDDELHYSLFMDLADEDLQKLFKRPLDGAMTSGKRATFLSSAAGLAEGLEFLHDKLSGGRFQRLQCHHMDLKPSNILIFRREKDPARRWKISDFGMSKVTYTTNEDDEDTLHFDRPFQQRSRPDRPLGTYGAPESLSSEPTMGVESDVWSLGAIISMLFVYLEYGSKGVDDYGDKRCGHPHADERGCFFLYEGRKSTELLNHPEVTAMHDELIRTANSRNKGNELEGTQLSKILKDFLEGKVFILNQGHRTATAAECAEQLAILYRWYDRRTQLGSILQVPGGLRRLSQDIPASQVRKWFKSRRRPLLRWQLNYAARIRSPFQLSRGTSESEVEGALSSSYSVNPGEKFRYCANPAGAFVAAWSEKDIILYPQTSFANASENGELPTGSRFHWSDFRCSFKEVHTTWDYLAASTTSDYFDMIIFALRPGPEENPSLEFCYHLRLPDKPPVLRFELSPGDTWQEGENWLPVILGSKRDHRRLGEMFIIDVISLITPANEVGSEHRFENHVSPRPKMTASAFSFGETAKLFGLTCSFGGQVYTMIKPKSAHPNEGIQQLIMKSCPMHDPNSHISSTLPNVLDSHDANNAPSCIVFAPLHTRNGCILIIKKYCVWIPPLSEDRQPLQIELANYNIHKLLIEIDDRRIFALGTRKHHIKKMLLLSMPMPEDNRSVVPTMEAELEHVSQIEDVQAMTLSGDKNERFILVVTSKGHISRIRVSAM